MICENIRLITSSYGLESGIFSALNIEYGRNEEKISLLEVIYSI